LGSESNFPMQSIASYLLAAIDTVAGTFGSPEIGLLILGLLAGLISAPFSYTGRRALEPVQSLAPQIQSLRARHGDDRRSLQRALLELYQQHAINPWAPLLGLIPAAIEVLLVVLLYLVVGTANALPAPAYLGWLTDLSSRDPLFILAGAMGLLLIIQAKADIRSNPPRQNRVKLFLQVAVPAAKFMIATALPSGVIIAWLSYSAVATMTQRLATIPA